MGMLLAEVQSVHRAALERLPKQHLGQAHAPPERLGAILGDPRAVHGSNIAGTLSKSNARETDRTVGCNPLRLAAVPRDTSPSIGLRPGGGSWELVAELRGVRLP